MRLQLLLFAKIGVFGVQEVRELFTLIITTDQVDLSALLGLEHSVLFLASEALGRPCCTLTVDAVSLWSGLRHVCHRGQIALIAWLRVAHPLLGVLVAHSALLDQCDDYVLHELLSLIHQQAKAIAVNLLEAVACLD